MDGKVKIVKPDEIFEEFTLPYNFDTNLYRKLNDNFKTENNVFEIEKIKNNISTKQTEKNSLKQIL